MICVTAQTAQTNQLGNPHRNQTQPHGSSHNDHTQHHTLDHNANHKGYTPTKSPPQQGMAYNHWSHSNIKRKHIHGSCHPLIPTHTTCTNSTNTTHINTITLAPLHPLHGLITGSHITTLFRNPLPNNTHKN